MKYYRLVGILFVCLSFSSIADILWKTKEITFEIKKYHPLVGKGYMIELNQKLAESESGWKQARYDIPESWRTATIKMDNDKIIILIKGKSYFIHSSNMGKLLFDILDDGKKSDSELEKIWQEHASNT